MSRQTGDTRNGWQVFAAVALGVLAGVVAAAGAVAVAVAGFTLSFDAIRAVGQAAHMRAGWAWLLPVSVDGAMAVATVAAVVLHRLTGRTARYPWAVVIAGAAISVACNGLHATGQMGPKGQPVLDLGPIVRFAVSAIPAVMLTLSVHLLVLLLDVAARKIDAGSAHVRAEQERAANANAQRAERERARADERAQMNARAQGAQESARVPNARAANGDGERARVRADEDANVRAREVYAQSVAAELPLSGRALAQMFDRSATWGRERINEVKAESVAAPSSGEVAQ